MPPSDRAMFEGWIENGQPPLNQGEKPRRNPLDEKVDLISAAEPYWVAWLDLQGQRPIGGMGGFGEMRYEAVTSWLDENGVDDPAERDRFRSFLRKLDQMFLEDAAKRMEKMDKKVDIKAPTVRGRGPRTEYVRT